MYELINNIPLRIKEYNGHRVVTFRDIDTVHNRPEGTASRNFRKNRERFIKNEDYFILELTTDEIRRQFGAGKNAGRTMILLTESGYLMLVKSFTDELAWSVQRQLVNTYFRVQEICNFYENDIYIKLDMLERKIDALEKSSENRADNLVRAVKESIAETAVATAQALIPCFVYTRKKLKKLRKELKNDERKD